MKNLVLSTLFVAVASQAAGCIFVSDDDPNPGDLGDISVSWSLKSTNAAVPGNPDVAAACPAGATSAILFALPVGAAPSTAFQDGYDCVDNSGVIGDLEPGTYDVWVQLTDTNVAVKFAESFSQRVTVNGGSVTPVTTDIYVDRGFFLVGWNLTGRAASCSGIANGGVSILATDGGGAALGFDTLVDCVEGEGRATISQPLPVRPAVANTTARYTIAVSLLNQATPAQSIGDAAVQANRGFDNVGNDTDDLGILPINVR